MEHAATRGTSSTVQRRGGVLFNNSIPRLVEGIRAKGAQTEHQRCVSDETIRDLRDAGLFRAFVPRRCGGDERIPSEVYEAVIELARGCASTAWVASLLSVHSFSIALLERAGQDDMLAAGPDLLISSSVAPMGIAERVEGGFRLSGRWSFVSGVDHAQWLMLGAAIKDEPACPPSPGASTFPGFSSQNSLFFLPAADCRVHDDWDVAGLCGTGSKAIEVKAAFVPMRHVLSLVAVNRGVAPGLALDDGPYYRVPWFPLFHSAFPPVAIGTALAMLDGFRAYTNCRVSSFSGKGYHTNAGPRVRLAEAAAQVDAARALYRRDVATLDNCAKGEPLPRGVPERIVYDAACIVHACSRAIDQLYCGSGGRAIYRSSPLQRQFRDIHAITQHVMADLDTYSEAYGKALLENPDFAFGAAGSV